MDFLKAFPMNWIDSLIFIKILNLINITLPQNSFLSPQIIPLSQFICASWLPALQYPCVSEIPGLKL